MPDPTTARPYPNSQFPIPNSQFPQFLIPYISGMAGKKTRRWAVPIILVFIVVGGFLFFEVFGPNTGAFTQGQYLYVHTGATYDDVVKELKENGFIRDAGGFELVARAMKLQDNIHAGRYKIEKMMSSYRIARLLRSGKQSPVKLVINKVRTKRDLVRLISTNLEADSFVLMRMLSDPEQLKEFGVDTGTALAMVIPDTYEFFWNTPADKALRKIHKNYVRYWSDARKQKAKAQGVTPLQAITIASIVEEETNMAGDKPNIASVYLNRIRKGMKLQADPTVKYAIGDFTIKRVTGAMLEYNSPYNTYMYEGVPPGPICTPSLSSLNAVLDAPRTTYLYFCARPDFSGYSAFASTYDQQINNANAYRKALDARGIH